MKLINYRFILFLGLLILISCQLTTKVEKATDSDPISMPSFDMNFVNGGIFTMGYPGIANETHQVTLNSFSIGKKEVTYELWIAVRQRAEKNNNYVFANRGREGSDGVDDVIPGTTKNKPVTNINWRDVIIWCNALSEQSGLVPCYYSDSGYTKVIKKSSNDEGNEFSNTVYILPASGYRLPTEAEWEYAACYITNGSFREGDKFSGDNKIADVAWFSDNSDNNAHETGNKNANQLGCFDMTGNVWEFTFDWYENYPSNPVLNPIGPQKGIGKSIRGGSFASKEANCMLASRAYIKIQNKSIFAGFRLAKN